MTDMTTKAMTLDEAQKVINGVWLAAPAACEAWKVIDAHLSAQREGEAVAWDGDKCTCPVTRFNWTQDGMEPVPQSQGVPNEYVRFEDFAKLHTTPPPPRVEVPDGWKLVPIKPTQKMLDAPAHMWHPEALNVWKDMLAAAPSQPRRPAHPHVTVTSAMVLNACDAYNAENHKLGNVHLSADVRCIRAALEAALSEPTP
jgi:hypothetical protein